MSLNFLSFTALVFCFSASASANNDNAYLKLHQATGLYEQYVSKQCASGKAEAQKLLYSLDDPTIAKNLRTKINELKKLIGRNKTLSVTELESFRLSIYELQERLKLRHEDSWHDELVAQCKS